MNSITNTYKSRPSNLNQRVPLDFNTALTIPESHIWTDQFSEIPVVQQFAPVPLINLSDPNAKSLIRHACEIWGVFHVINHGIPMNLLNEVQLQTRHLFSLPIDRKLSTLRSPDGITGYGQPRISTVFPKLMWSECFLIMQSPMEHALQLWPQEPYQQTSFCNVMEEYQKEVKRTTEKILELMLESLGLTVEVITWLKPKMSDEKAQRFLQLNSYPPCPDPDQAMGLGPHTDSSLLTVLYQSPHTGLQVRRDGIGWMPVQAISDAVVVNVGDLMQILTNGRFKSNMHRAVVCKTHRTSIAYFYGPPSDVKISPLTSLIDHNHPLICSPVTWKEYLYYKSLHSNNAFEFIGK